jgi:aspartyl/asparaginyl beta-hydroxylase (cupin superfamily)
VPAVARFGAAVDILDRLPLSRQGQAPAIALLVLLDPGVETVRLHGQSNAHMTVLFPLRVEPGVQLSVGGEVAPVRAGQPLAFDDSYEHQFRNHSDGVFAGLMVEAWRPDLAAADCRALEASLTAVGNWLKNRQA